jgi:RNA polymerase sigma-70 factor (ECF subfamily)
MSWLSSNSRTGSESAAASEQTSDRPAGGVLKRTLGKIVEKLRHEDDMTATALPGSKLTKEMELLLIQQAHAGDPSAGARLVDAHKQRLYTFIWRMVRDAELAEDLCQEAFLRAFNHLGSFNIEYRFSTWLFTIGYRLALNELRTRTAHRTTVADLANVAEEKAERPDTLVLQSEQASRLKEMIWSEVDQLSTTQKAVVLMFYREGLSCKEISDSLEIPVATVKSHMHRARERLRVKLERQGVDQGDVASFGA